MIRSLAAAVLLAGMSWGALWQNASILPRLKLIGNVQRESGQLVGHVLVMNSTDAPIKVGVAGFPCATNLVLRSAGGEIVWDQRHVQDGGFGGCKWFPMEVELAAHDTMELRSSPVAVDEILGDSLQPGEYAAGVRVIFARLVAREQGFGSTTRIDSVAVVDAGRVRLRE